VFICASPSSFSSPPPAPAWKKAALAARLPLQLPLIYWTYAAAAGR